MKENTLKSRLKAGEVTFGMLTPIYDPQIVEVIGHLGFDFYMMDCEHGAGGPTEAEHFVRACETVGMTPLARIRSTDPKLILRFFDAGMLGLIMPSMRNAADVKNLVDAVKYPPLGMRGIAPVRANDYLLTSMLQDEYVRLSNAQTLVLPQIELVEAIDNLDSILEVEGIDGFIVGPRDLSMSMGFADGPAHEEVWNTVYKVFERVRAAGLVVGTTAGTAEEARRHIDHGAQMILGSVTGLLKVGTAQFFKAKSAG